MTTSNVGPVNPLRRRQQELQDREVERLVGQGHVVVCELDPDAIYEEIAEAIGCTEAPLVPTPCGLNPLQA